jgi:hypothetical protein
VGEQAFIETGWTGVLRGPELSTFGAVTASMIAYMAAQLMRRLCVPLLEAA